MNLRKVIVFLVMFNYACGFEPFTTFAAIGSLFATAWNYCLYECCRPGWVDLDTSALKQNLVRKLYGQHLVSNIINTYMKTHVKRKPSKALTLSFHGGSGSGKTYVSSIIAESMFRKGMHSSFVHFISATTEFPHKEKVSLYKEKLKNLIESGVAKCPHSLFIFDEIDKMPTGILDILTPYIDYNKQYGGVDYRNAIFIFLSNTGAEAILNHTLTHAREQIRLKEMEQIIREAVSNVGKNGLYESSIIFKNLMTAYVPFLPLEKKHIRSCIKDVLISKNYYNKREKIPGDLVDTISRELNYVPDDKELFSTTGCKRIPEKVDYVMDDY